VGKWLAILLISVMSAPAAQVADSAREQVIKIIAQIQRADYEGDRAALKRLYGELQPFVKDQGMASRVRYWRGFALWRRAINGSNESTDTKEWEDDLQQALEEFNESAAIDPDFVDAKIAALSCVGILAYSFNQKNPERQQELIAQGRQLKKDAQAAAPLNPRFLWVLGPNVWYTPPEHGGGQEKAMELYEKGLQVLSENKVPAASNPLDPSWGEPELLMNLAWSNLNRTAPDLDAADQYAHCALALVPYWHYVKGILIPQIQDARKKPH